MACGLDVAAGVADYDHLRAEEGLSEVAPGPVQRVLG
jgi:hypothetical protein